MYDASRGRVSDRGNFPNTLGSLAMHALVVLMDGMPSTDSVHTYVARNVM
jgi:hypothetical protein